MILEDVGAPPARFVAEQAVRFRTDYNAACPSVSTPEIDASHKRLVLL
jgi:hypothetical protein